MSVRNGMVNLIAEARSLTDTSENEVTVNGVSYWSDEQLQDVLDRRSFDIHDVYLTPRPMYYNGSYEYRKYLIPKMIGRFIENDSSVLSVVDSNGNLVSQPYTVDLNKGIIEFSNDANSTTYYLRGTGYEFYEAIADIWQQKASHRTQLVKFRAGSNAINADSEYLHCIEQVKIYRNKKGLRRVILTQRGQYC